MHFDVYLSYVLKSLNFCYACDRLFIVFAARNFIQLLLDAATTFLALFIQFSFLLFAGVVVPVAFSSVVSISPIPLSRRLLSTG